MKKLLALKAIRSGCLFVLVSVWLSSTAMAFDYDEAIGGDLPGCSQPPLFPFDVGANTVSGTIEGAGCSALDSIRFTVAPDTQLVSINLELATGNLFNSRYSIRTGDNATELVAEETVDILLSAFNGPLLVSGLPLGPGDYRLHHAGFSGFSTPDNDYTFTFEVASATLEIQIDVKPGSDPNCFNANGHGVIPVAILGSDTFDVLDIDTSALFFAGLEVRVRGKKGPLCHGEDVNGDEFLDLVCQFEDDTSMWTPESNSEATLAGQLFDGTEFEGTDSICVTQEVEEMCPGGGVPPCPS